MTSDPDVCRAGVYFSLTSVAGRWRNVCDQLSDISVESERAKVIIEDTKTLFDLFARAASGQIEEHLQPKELVS